MINFTVVSSDLRPHVLDTRAKRGAELSADHAVKAFSCGGFSGIIGCRPPYPGYPPPV